MAKPLAETDASETARRGPGSTPRQRTALEIGRPFGITIALDWSLLIIALLIASTLSMGALPEWHPQWSPQLRWTTGASAAVLLFFSVLVHEFSHALVARRFGTAVDRITLFIFGGMAHIDQEPKTWKAEMLIALAGPVVSILLGIAFLWPVGLALAGMEGATAQEVFAAMGPLETLLFWAGNINIILALFNLVPAYPLDGGRVLRALFWAWSGDIRKATVWAAAGGRLFGWILVVLGFSMIIGVQVPIFGTGVVGGMWLIFIGWFLARTALMSMENAATQGALDSVPVHRIMRTEFASVVGNMSLQNLVEELILPRGQRAFPVLENQQLLGLISFDDVRRVPQQKWSHTTVRDVMTPADKLVSIHRDDESTDALAALGSHQLNQLLVLDHSNKVVGLLHREDIMNWLALYQPFSGKAASGP